MDHETGNVSSGQGPAANASLETGYRLLSGGAKVTTENLFLTKSAPNGNSWEAWAKNHYYPENGSIKAYAIGISTDYIEEIEGYIETAYSVSPLAFSEHTEGGYATAKLNGGIPSGFVETGVGGWVQYDGAGRLLTQVAPSDESALHDDLNVKASSKDHSYDDSGDTYVYAIAIKKEEQQE